MDEFDDRQPRLGAPAAAVLLATVLLSAAICYNALWRQAQDLSLTEFLSGDRTAQGSTRVFVDLDQPQSRTVTLRFDPTVEAVQRELAASGLYTGPIDGVSGRRTQIAILAYQRMNRLDETGAASADLIDHIQLTRQFAEAADTTASLTPGISGDSVRSVQLRLEELGYDPGAIDGELGDQTKIAIRRFQADRRMTISGAVSEELIIELNKNDPRLSQSAQ
jgi:peptidoglycan hydrolase-like protein with peptidoglycan-binding domain